MRKIALVDDCYAEVQMLERMLKAARYTVVSFPNADHLEEKLMVERPDVVVLDVIMPGRNGFQVCRELRDDSRFKHIPIVICTSKNQESDKFWGAQQGADAYVTKPFKREELLAVVDKALHR